MGALKPGPLPSRASGTETIELSVVAPAFNEEGNLDPLHRQIVRALEPLGVGFEAIYVDDGSTDGTFTELTEIARRDPRARVIRFRRNFGQTAALSAGVDLAHGRRIVFIDADLQNDAADIPRLLALMDEGYDVVSGWRTDRQDARITRILPSRIANIVISRVTGLRLHDYGCALKAYRTELLRGVHLYGEMHRFLPAYVALQGADVTEIPVRHHPRVRGKSKYGLRRTFKVLLDLLTLEFLGSFTTKPIYMFGGLGLASIALSFLIGLGMVWQKLAMGTSFIRTPLLLLAALLFLAGFQSILMGLLSELLMRTYHETQGKPIYLVRTTLNTGPSAPVGLSAHR